jgi:uncharacterized Zn-finger protein
MSALPAAGSRKHEEVFVQEVGEELHECGYCFTRTELDEAMHYATGALNHTCPHCGQRYKLEEVDEEDSVSFDGEGEIEIVDEQTGEVLGMTQPPEPDKLTSATEKLKARLAKIAAEASSLDGVLADLAPPEPVETLEASLGDLDHLFGIKPSPYGDDFGSFG